MQEVLVDFRLNDESKKYGCYLFSLVDNKKFYLFLDETKIKGSITTKYENIVMVMNEKFKSSDLSYEMNGTLVDLKLLEKEEMIVAHKIFLNGLKNNKTVEEILEKLNKQFSKWFKNLVHDYNNDYAKLLLMLYLSEDSNKDLLNITHGESIVFPSNFITRCIEIKYDQLKSDAFKYVLFLNQIEEGMDIISLANKLLYFTKILRKSDVKHIKKIKKKYNNKTSLPKYSIENTLKDITVELNNVLNNINLNDDKIQSANFIIQLD